MTTRPQNDDSIPVVESTSVNLPITKITTNSFNSVSNIDISNNDEHISMDNYYRDELYSEQADQETVSDQAVAPASDELTLADIDIDESVEKHEVLDKPSNDKLSMVRNSEAGLYDDDYAEEDGDRYGRHHSGYGSDTSSNTDDIDLDDDDRDDIRPPKRKNPASYHRGNSKLSSRVRDEAYRESEIFATQKKTASKYGNSDSIKVISTPHGKVSIVYQSSTPTKQNVSKSDPTRKETPLVEQNKQLKITPVLTPDGKVALLYRGASDITTNNKYEPIVNVPSKATETGVLSATNASITDGTIDDGQIRLPTKLSANQTIIHNEMPVVTDEPKDVDIVSTQSPQPSNVLPAETPSKNSNEEENAILPNINRPPSEVLGIKKNQFIQFRITDGVVTATPAISGQSGTVTDAPPPPPPPNQQSNNHHDDSVPNFEYDYESNGESRENDPMAKNDHLPVGSRINSQTDRSNSPQISDILSKTEVVNLAIIPSFDSHMKTNGVNRNKADENDNEIVFDVSGHEIRNGKSSVDSNAINDNRLHHHRHPHLNERDLTAIHCAMQAMVAIAAISTIIGMIGAYFKQRVFDQITSMH